jgi:hypothetical protein
MAMEYEKAEAAGGSKSACGEYLIASIAAFNTDGTYLEALREERTSCEEESRRVQAAAEVQAKELRNHISQREWGSTPADPCYRKSKNTKSTTAVPAMEHAVKVLKVDAVADSNVEANLIRVNKESLAVFEMMYRTDCLAGGTIRWQEFVQAMKGAGFAAQEASGSAVTFRDRDDRRICFHRPHPEPVLDHIMLYGMAKRMAKWFGFSAERFVLREKSCEGSV